MQTLQIVFAVLIGGIALIGTLGGGGVLLAHHVPAVIEGWMSRSWPQTPAVITRSATVKTANSSGWSRGPTGTHVVRIAYEYRLGAQVYVGSRSSLDAEGKISSAENAQRSADRFPVGRAVTARYNPRDPARSLLEAGIPVGGVLGIFFGLLLIGTGAAFIGLGMRLRSHHLKRRLRRRA